jgi:hypothetical protein
MIPLSTLRPGLFPCFIPLPTLYPKIFFYNFLLFYNIKLCKFKYFSRTAHLCSCLSCMNHINPINLRKVTILKDKGKAKFPILAISTLAILLHKSNGASGVKLLVMNVASLRKHLFCLIKMLLRCLFQRSKESQSKSNQSIWSTTVLYNGIVNVWILNWHKFVKWYQCIVDWLDIIIPLKVCMYTLCSLSKQYT